MGTFLLNFNNTVYESTDSSGTSWVQEPFPAGGPKGVSALGTGASVAGWVLDGNRALPVPLWRRVDQNTFVPLNVTSDLSPNFLDFYTVPYFFPPSGGGNNVLGDIGVPTGQSQQMYVQSTDAGRTAQTFSFGNLPTSGNTLMRFWADERQFSFPTNGFFLAQVRQQPSGSDFLYAGILPNSWSQLLQSGAPISTGGSVQDIRADFIRKQNGTFLVSIHQAPVGNIAIIRSAGGGWTVASMPTNAVPNPGLVECDDGTVLVPSAAGVPGFVLRSTDDGQTFQSTLAISGVTVAQVWLKYFPGLNMLFAYVWQQTGPSAPFGTAVYLSTDQGQSWTQVFAQALAVGQTGPQVTSWMALTNGNTFWGVDSSTPANTDIPGGKFFDVLTNQAGSPPSFWGRYIARIGGNLTPAEVSFLHGLNCKILLIYAGVRDSTGAQTYPQGVSAATTAIGIASAPAPNGLAVPGGKRVWIYCNTEAGWSPTAAFFQGWFDTMFSSQYGGGVYGNTGATVFNTPYCAAYTDPNDPNIRMGASPSLLWNNQPLVCDGATKKCDILAAHAPAFNPNRPPCNPPTVIYQYSINNTLAGVKRNVADVDLDVANGAGFAGMW